MITLERRDDGYVTPECRLKFWGRSNSDTLVYTLHTTIESPHTKYVTSLDLGLAVTQLTAVTTSNDSHVKLWQHNNVLEVKEEESEDEDEQKVKPIDQWQMKHVVTYQSLPSYCSTFSADGTILCVAYKGVLVLYCCDSFDIKAQIDHPINRVSQMFLSGFYLVSSAKDLLSVWDLRSLSLWWQASSSLSYVLQLPKQLFIAFISRKRLTDAYVFHPESSEPLKVHRFVCPGHVKTACLVNNKIVMVNNENEVYILDSSIPPPIAVSLIQDDSPVRTVFSELLKISSKPADQVEIKGLVNVSTVTAILSCPNSAMPPLSNIAGNILSGFLPKKT